MREPCLGGTQSSLRDGGRPACVLDSTSRNRSLGEQTFCAFLLDARSLDGHPRLGDIGFERRAVGSGREPWIQAAQNLARPNTGADREQRVRRKPSSGWCRDDRFTARERMYRRRHANGCPHFGFHDTCGSERVGPLLLFQVGDGPRIVSGVLPGICASCLQVRKDGDCP